MKIQAISNFPVGTRVRLAELKGNNILRRRLMALGLVQGNSLEIMHQRGKSVVVQSKGSRVALGADIAEKLWVERI